MSRSRFSLYAAALCVACCLAAAPAQAALPAWSPVAATNPTNLSTLRSETQRLLISAEGGTFKLSIHRSGRGTVVTTNGSTTATDAVAFGGKQGGSGEFIAGQTITKGDNGIFAPGTIITAVNGNILTLSKPASGGTTGSWSGFEADMTIGETTAIPVGSSAQTVEAALNAALPAGGDVSVSGGPQHGDESSYLVTFGGNLAGQGIGPMTVERAQLTGVTPSTGVLATKRGGRGLSELILYAQNVGGAVSTGETVTFTVTLPAGVGVARTPFPAEFGNWSCPPVPYGATSFSCTTTKTAAPGSPLSAIDAPIETGLNAPTVLPVQLSVTGGGAAAPGAYVLPLTVSPLPAAPGVQSFTGGAYNENGEPDTQAGAHPYTASSAVFVNTVTNPATGQIIPAGEFKDIVVELPPGFLGNPVAVQQCPEYELDLCSKNTVIGRVIPLLEGTAASHFESQLFDVEAPLGHAGEFYFKVGLQGQEVPLHAIGDLRSDEDYGITVSSLETPQIATVMGAFFTFWGTPGDSAHNSQRGGAYTGGPVTAFLTNPTDCAEEASVASTSGLVGVHGEPFIPVKSWFTTWQNPGEIFHSVFGVPPVTGCAALKFESHFTFQPSEAVSADSPSGFTTNLTIPSEGLTNPNKLATPELKRFVAHLPSGVVLNPSAAGGLGSCSEAQIGLINEVSPVTGLPVLLAMPNPIRFNKNPNTCPESSKVGTVEINTPLLNEPLHGALYIAAQGKGNPFGSLFAVYLVIEDPRNGIFIKVPGEVEPDKQTGQVSVTFDDLPQVPFDSLKLVVKGGSRSPFATPDTCGTFTTKTVNTPWSAPESGAPFETEDSFNVNSGAGGSACVNTPAERPFAPSLTAGSASNTAGAFTSFSLRLSRNDGEQELSSVDTVAPPGFVGVLTGVPFCPEAAIEAAEANTGTAEQQSPSCPAASLLGTLTAAVGVGSTPFYASGKAYLAGAYEGDPFSIVFITPAVAGPFDLGDVVVRAAIHVDPETAQISVKTDQIPQILDGVPLQVRSITANIDRPNFGLNPTNCERFKVSTTAYGASGAVSSSSNPFQVNGCAGLAFKPQFAVSTSAKTSRANGASLTARLSFPSREGEANIARVKVDLPKQLPSRLTTLQKACTEMVFDANPANCPRESIVGYAKAITPVLPVPLVGPAYFVSHGGAKFPELILVLQGYGVTIDLRGETFINPAGITSSTFNTVPDVAVGSFELTLPQGPYSALAANGNLCAGKLTMPTAFTAQDGQVIHQSTPITVAGCTNTKTLTNTQKLKQALKTCHKLKNKTKQAACETTARKKYETKSKKAKKSTKKKGR